MYILHSKVILGSLRKNIMKSVIDISNKILLLDNKIFPEGTNIFRVVFKSLSIAWYARRSSVKALRF